MSSAIRAITAQASLNPTTQPDVRPTSGFGPRRSTDTAQGAIGQILAVPDEGPTVALAQEAHALGMS